MAPAPRSLPQRIALFSGNYNYTRDGSNQALNRLVGHLETTCGAEVRVYAPVKASPAFRPSGAVIAAPSIAIPGRPDYRLATGLPSSLREEVIRFDPEIVHLSAPDPLGWQAAGLARRLGAPVVASVHTRFDSYLRYYGVAWLKTAALAYMRAFYRRCDYLLAPSGPTAEWLEAICGGGGRVRIWGRGVDGALFHPGRRSQHWRLAHGISDGDVAVLYLGRLVREKGLAIFADAAEAAAARDRRIRVLVVGAGPEEVWLRRRLPKAIFTGGLSGEELGMAVASADVMFTPSVTECFSNATLEAMSAGLPIICADTPEQRALVSSKAGLLRPADDAAAFAEAILELTLNPAERWSLGASGLRESVRYSWEHALQQAVGVYREAMAARELGLAATEAGVSRCRSPRG